MQAYRSGHNEAVLKSSVNQAVYSSVILANAFIYKAKRDFRFLQTFLKTKISINFSTIS